MTQLPTTAPAVHHVFLNGNFVARHAGGSHNAISTDMLLEHAKEVSGLEAISQNYLHKKKDPYQTTLKAGAFFYLKSMLDLNTETQEAGKAWVANDATRMEKPWNVFRRIHSQQIRCAFLTSPALTFKRTLLE